jgi:inosose dehydratase
MTTDGTTASTVSAAPTLPNLQLGTAPDSSGVWFPDDPHQVPWHQFLDEAAAADYTAVELGPFGYLPTEPEQLRDELGRRGLTLTGATAGTHLHRGGDSPTEALAECRQVAALLAAMEAPYLITLPEMYTDLYSGKLLEPAQLTAEQWTSLATGHSELGRVLQEEYGLRQMFHPHADAHVAGEDSVTRFLEGTDPATVSLCLDTGHIPYAGGDNRAIIAEHPDRIGYVHLKSVAPDVLARVRDEGMSFAQAVQSGAMVEPTQGEPGHAAAAGGPQRPRGAADGDRGARHVPAPADKPLPIATRTHRYYSNCGVSTVHA